MASKRLQYVELRKSSAGQILLFFTIFLLCSVAFFRTVGVPAAEKIFSDSFNATVEKEGEELNLYTNWRMTVDGQHAGRTRSLEDDQSSKVYYYNPLLAIFPLVLAVGLFCAGLFTAVLSPKLGYIRQKIEREIIAALHHFARLEYNDHSDKDLQDVSELIRKADIHRLHELEERWNTSFAELEVLQQAIRWRERNMMGRLLRVDDAMRLYLRNHFTIRYENPVLGMIYIGAAILIIIIGLRGLQFIPKDRPSLVLFAISLEFILLIVYAITLIYTKETEATETDYSGMDVNSLFSTSQRSSSTQQAEKMLRMFVSNPVDRQ